MMRPPRPVPSLTLAGSLFVASLAGQAASYSYLPGTAAQGCSPVGPAVEHQAIGLPVVGATFGLRASASNGDCSYLCNLHLLALGISNTHYGTLPLPALPLQLGLPGCGSLRVSPDLQLWMPLLQTGAPAQTVSFLVPNAPSLAGQQFFVQSVAATWILGGLNAVAMGRAGQGTIGF